MFYPNGYVIKKIKNSEKKIYLTFDDGPDLYFTEEILALLESEKIFATFFLVAVRAKKNPLLVKKILDGGHGIGNHSYDHHYCPFFKGKYHLEKWIQKSEKTLQDIIGRPTIGFRSPAGVVNYSLVEALKKLKMPLIHWSVRFYDTVFTLDQKAVSAAISKMQSGDIVLLHDTLPKQKEHFLSSLLFLITEAKKNGFVFEVINGDRLI